MLDLLLGLLRQIAVKSSSLLATIEHMHAHHIQKRTCPSVSEVQAELLKTSNSYKMIFIVIDALDEYCSSNLSELQDLLSAFIHPPEKGAH